ncbi:MAG TPA: hypothetical protein VE954_19225 [Oligoflexus sp.]|uniref:hypothetical protein n=1 Tax=Oligoflexus sp. TaxID=1971216 RepID=UPI002D603D65|nr:hypothetical protein [Oligoflexus sp.]HYX35233.1 hypothetical protein [Oligoflexus sp.]
MKHFASGLMVTLLLSMPAFGAGTDDLSKARAQVEFVYQRLTGIRPAAADLATWSAALAPLAGADRTAYLADVVGKAATENDLFYSVTVLNFAQIEASEDRSVAEGSGATFTGVLNDLTATVIGMVRDEKDYRAILSDDVLYIPTGTTYVPGTNAIYDTLYNTHKTTGGPIASALTAVTQTGATGLAVQAGIFTLRGFGSVYYDAGTNRAPFRFTSMNYLCRDMEDLSDVSRADIYVRRDVDRAPGGDASKYRTECVGCHAGMDPLANSFSFFNFVPPAQANAAAAITIAAAPVAKTNQNNDVFPGGAVVTNDAWMNLWLEGTNSALGWDATKKSGTGVKSLGDMLASSKMFPECMAKRVYKTVCGLKEETSTAEKAVISRLAGEFTKTYNMKELFKDTAAECVSKIGM